MEHLRLLAALPRLTVLNLYHMTWAEDTISMSATLLATILPRLRVLNIPGRALVRSTVHATVLIDVKTPPLSLRRLSERGICKCGAIYSLFSSLQA